LGFSRQTRESSALVGGVPLTGKAPAGQIFQDGDGNDWYMWFDNAGTMRVADAATVEAAGFNAWNTGGGVAAARSVGIPLTGTMVDQHVFVADRAYKVSAINEIHSVVGGAGANVRPRKITDTSAPGAVAGATVKELTTAVFDLTAVINTTQTGVLSATAADLLLATGDKIALDFSGTITGLVGMLTITLAPIG
jgi:hypothetical protein